jgi:hypothetical protein
MDIEKIKLNNQLRLIQHSFIIKLSRKPTTQEIINCRKFLDSGNTLKNLLLEINDMQAVTDDFKNEHEDIDIICHSLGVSQDILINFWELSTEAFIEKIYLFFLGRIPDIDGFNSHKEGLEMGANRNILMLNMFNSQEAEIHRNKVNATPNDEKNIKYIFMSPRTNYFYKLLNSSIKMIQGD